MIGANQQLTILSSTPGARDANGVSTLTWTITDQISGCFRQKNAHAYVNGTWQVIEQWEAIVPPTTAVDHTSVIRTEDGTDYRVQTVATWVGLGGGTYVKTALCVKAGA